MAAPVLEESNGSSFTFGSSTGLTCTFDATPADDEIVELIYMVAGASSGISSPSWPSGFSEHLAPTSVTGEVQMAAAWKAASSEGSAAYAATWTAGSGGNERLIGNRFSGADTTDPWDDLPAIENVSFPGTSFSAGAATASLADTLHCMALCSNGNLSAPTVTGYAETVYNQAFGGNSFGMDARAHFNDAITSSGSISAQSFGMSGGGFFNVMIFTRLLKPAGGGGGGGSAFRRRESGMLVPFHRPRYY